MSSVGRADGHRESFLAKFSGLIESAAPPPSRVAAAAAPPREDSVVPSSGSPGPRWSTRHGAPGSQPIRRVGGYFDKEGPADESPARRPDPELVPSDRFRSMVYEDMLLAAARRNFSGLDLHTVDDNRRQWYDSQKSLRFERQREKEREWENEMWLRGERQKSRLRERERELAREREWERVCERERDKARDRERDWEREKEELRRAWIEERERQRERERERESQWEISLELEREQFREAQREWEREKETHRLQVRQQEWEWEQDREKLRKQWELRRKEEQQMEQALLDDMDRERRSREEAWEKERLELMEKYAAARHTAIPAPSIGPPATAHQSPAASRRPSAAPSHRGSVAPQSGRPSAAPSRRPSAAPSQAQSRRQSVRPMTPDEIHVITEAIHKKLLRGEADSIAENLKALQSDLEWGQVQTSFRTQHPDHSGGDLREAISVELSEIEIAAVRDVLGANGVQWSAEPTPIPRSPSPAASQRSGSG